VRRGPAVLVLALVAMLLSACSIRTLGAPTGDVKLVATFDDAQNLVPGHSVQLADVKIGSVTAVKLVGYRVKVTMSIKNEYKIPVGTAAEISVTSLLGENYVKLKLPPNASMAGGPFLANGAEITQTSVTPQFETITAKAGELLKALAGNDLSTVVTAGATSLGGNGPKLNALVAKSSQLVDVFGRQREQLGTAVEELARLGRSLANGQDQLAQAPGELERTTSLILANKDKALTLVRNLTRTARLLNQKVLLGRVAELRTTLNRLDPVLQQLGSDRARLTSLVNGLERFVNRLPRATYDGQLLLYPILKIVLPGQTKPIDFGGGTTSAKTKKGATASDPLAKLRDLLPNLDQLLEHH
jgi:phospholipid/cholesterol/gamma-HCH transport system substrate-binding protein